MAMAMIGRWCFSPPVPSFGIRVPREEPVSASSRLRPAGQPHLFAVMRRTLGGGIVEGQRPDVTAPLPSRGPMARPAYFPLPLCHPRLCRLRRTLAPDCSRVSTPTRPPGAEPSSQDIDSRKRDLETRHCQSPFPFSGYLFTYLPLYGACQALHVSPDSKQSKASTRMHI